MPSRGSGGPKNFLLRWLMQSSRPLRPAAFPDHHPFTPADKAKLIQNSERLGAQLVTTTKDRARLDRDYPVTDVPVTLTFKDPTLVREWLMRACSPAAAIRYDRGI